MSTTIDNRVVEMQFDNHQFEKNVSTSLSTLDKLKQALNFDKSSKELNNFANSAGKFKLDGIASAVDSVSQKFSAFGIIGITTLQRLTNEAITAGKRIVSALTIDPVKTGLEEYETKMGAIQVIRANDQTASMSDISAALNELNTYADKTIYNFAQMTSNVGKFVAQGLGVKEAANAVRGMANLAAASGASASDMARATYQMSQALGGVIRKIDVNSLRNANMWTTTLKDALVDVARAEGVAIDEMIKEKGTLEETLEKGWLTGEMFTKVMNIYSGVYDEAQLRAMGFNDEQIQKFQQIAKTAEEAAVEIKTLSQLWDTLKENVQSGWTQTWELVIGNFEEAKQLWTDVSQVLSDFTNRMADRRNALLEGWKNLGGRDYFITGLWNALYSLIYLLDTVGEAFRNVFPEMTARQLVAITKQFKDFTQTLLLSDEGAARLKTVFSGIFSIFQIGLQVVSALAYGFKEILRVFSPITEAIKNLIVSVSGMVTAFAKTNTVGDALRKGLQKVVQFIEKNFGGAIQFIADKINQLANFESPFSKIGKSAEDATEKVSLLDKILNGVKAVFGTIKGLFSNFGSTVVKIAHTLAGAFDKIAESIVNSFKNADVNTALDFLKTGLLVGIGVAIKNFITKLTSPIDTFKDLVGGITDVLGSVGDALSGFTENVKAGMILKIGVAIGILAASLLVLSGIKPAALAAGLAAITALFGELFGMLALMNEFIGGTKIKGITKIAVLMLGMSAAVLILSAALRSLASIKVEDLGKGLLAVTVLIGEMTVAAIALSKFGGKIKTSALAMVLFAASINILVSAVRKLGELKPDVLAQGLKSVGILMAELVAFMVGAKFGKFGVGTGLAIIELAAGLLILQKAVQGFGNMPLDVITTGLIAIAGSLAVIALATNMMPKNLPIIATGLILVGAALNIMSKALMSFGGMSIEEIGKGLLVLAGSMTILALALNAMTATLAGSAALLIAAAALNVLAPALEKLGGMSLQEIGKGLLAMAGAFALLGVAGLVLAPLLPVILGLSGALLLAATAVGVASVALSAFTVALTALAVAGPAVVTAVTAMIPMILSSIGDGFAALISAIAKNAVTISNAFKDILIAIVTAIGEAIPTIVNTAMQLLSSLLNTFLAYVPSMVDAGLQLITGILQGIAANIQGIVEAAIDVVVNFIEGVASKLPDVIQAGFDLMISFINGLSDAIRNNTQAVVDAVSNMFDAVIDAAIQIVTGSVGRFISAGADAVGGLIQGIKSGIGSVGSVMADVGGRALDALGDAVGWHSPWESTYGMGVDGNRGLRDGLIDSKDMSINAAGSVGSAAGKEYVNSFKQEVSSLADKYGYNSLVSKYDPDARGNKAIRGARAFKEMKNNLNKTKDASDDLTKSTKNLGEALVGKGSGGGGGSAGAASSAAKETKKLFDVMSDGGKVVDKFADNFGKAYAALGYTTPLEMGQKAVEALAEKIYESSEKSKESTDDLAKTTEDKLAAMREAFVQFHDTLKSTIESQTDLFGKFNEKPSESVDQWNKNLDRQRVGIKSWEANIAALARRVKDYDLMSEIIKWGPEENARVRKMLSASDSALEHLVENIKGIDSMREDAVANAMASLATTVFEYEDASQEISNATEASSKTIQMVVWEAGESHSKLVDVVVEGNEKMVESAQNFAKFTEQALYAAADNYLAVRDSVADAVNSQLDIFSKFDDESELTGDELLDNMKSQLDGVRNWGDGLTTLLDRGLDQGLYQKLAEMGPKSWEYVHAFLEMTTDELNQANSYFLQSLTLGEDLGKQLGNDFAVAGLMASAGFSTGIDQSAGTAEVRQMAQNAINEIRSTLDINSPSGVTKEIGFNTSEGFAEGIASNTNAVGNIIKLANEVLSRFKASLPESEFRSIGVYLVQGLADGISSSSYIAEQAAASVMRSAIDAARDEAGIASPSKEFMKLGMYSDEGFANGLIKFSRLVTNSASEVAYKALSSVSDVMNSDDYFESRFEQIGMEANRGLALGLARYTDDVDKSAANVAETAIASMKNVISRIADVINGEVNLDPTIRPVLDLSGVTGGSAYINSMLGSASYGVASGISVYNDRESLRSMIDDAVARTVVNNQAASGPSVNMYIYGAEGQDERELADIIEQKLMLRINQRRATFV